MFENKTEKTILMFFIFLNLIPKYNKDKANNPMKIKIPVNKYPQDSGKPNTRV